MLRARKYLAGGKDPPPETWRSPGPRHRVAARHAEPRPPPAGLLPEGSRSNSGSISENRLHPRPLFAHWEGIPMNPNTKRVVAMVGTISVVAAIAAFFALGAGYAAQGAGSEAHGTGPGPGDLLPCTNGTLGPGNGTANLNGTQPLPPPPPCGCAPPNGSGDNATSAPGGEGNGTATPPPPPCGCPPPGGPGANQSRGPVGGGNGTLAPPPNCPCPPPGLGAPNASGDGAGLGANACCPPPPPPGGGAEHPKQLVQPSLTDSASARHDPAGGL